MLSSNLANIYAQLQKKYGEKLLVSYGNAPSYLSKIVGPDSEDVIGKILLIFEEDRTNARFQSFVSPSKLKVEKLRREGQELNLTGSPLRDDCIVDGIEDMSLCDVKLLAATPWSLEEECQKGIHIDRARHMLCAEDFQNTSCTARSVDTYGSVWILCDGSDAESTLLLQYEFMKGYFSRGIVRFLEMMPTYTVNTQTLLRMHFMAIRPGTPISTTVENTYRLNANIRLRCSWSTMAVLPSLIDLSSASDMVLSQTLHCGDSSPLTRGFLNQLRILKIIRDDIVAFKDAEGSGISTEAVYRCGCGIDMEEMRESITKAMTDISGVVEFENGNEVETDLEAVVKRTQGRSMCDLTDKLWDILKRCSSYKDLKLAFNILFQCAVRCNVVNTPTNKNRLAEIITEVANRRLAIPCLTGSEPLELLLEIGLEKVYKDYEHIFVESNISSVTNLMSTRESNDTEENGSNVVPNVRKSLRNAVRPDVASNGVSRKTFLHNKGNSKTTTDDDVMGFKNSNFHQQEVADRLSRLWQIHCALEHLLMIYGHLNLRNEVYADICEQLLRKPMRLVDCIDDTVKDEIEISISAHEVRDHLEGKDPHARRIAIESKNALREVRSIFYFNMENIFPPGLTKSCIAEDKEINKEGIYYGWLYRKIKTPK